MAHQRPIAIYYEHPQWFRPLFHELDRRETPYVRIDAGQHRFTPGEGFGSNNRSLYWINPKAFAVTPPLRFGTSGRDLISGPGFWNWDVSLFKNFRVSERVTLQFRAEFFDALNQVRFNPPNMDVSSPFFGQIQGAQAPRIIQLGLRLQF